MAQKEPQNIGSVEPAGLAGIAAALELPPQANIAEAAGGRPPADIQKSVDYFKSRDFARKLHTLTGRLDVAASALAASSLTNESIFTFDDIQAELKGLFQEFRRDMLPAKEQDADFATAFARLRTAEARFNDLRRACELRGTEDEIRVRLAEIDRRAKQRLQDLALDQKVWGFRAYDPLRDQDYAVRKQLILDYAKNDDDDDDGQETKHNQQRLELEKKVFNRKAFGEQMRVLRPLIQSGDRIARSLKLQEIRREDALNAKIKADKEQQRKAERQREKAELDALTPEELLLRLIDSVAAESEALWSDDSLWEPRASGAVADEEVRANIVNGYIAGYENYAWSEIENEFTPNGGQAFLRAAKRIRGLVAQIDKIQALMQPTPVEVQENAVVPKTAEAEPTPEAKTDHGQFAIVAAGFSDRDKARASGKKLSRASTKTEFVETDEHFKRERAKFETEINAALDELLENPNWWIIGGQGEAFFSSADDRRWLLHEVISGELDREALLAMVEPEQLEGFSRIVDYLMALLDEVELRNFDAQFTNNRSNALYDTEMREQEAIDGARLASRIGNQKGKTSAASEGGDAEAPLLFLQSSGKRAKVRDRARAVAQGRAVPQPSEGELIEPVTVRERAQALRDWEFEAVAPSVLAALEMELQRARSLDAHNALKNRNQAEITRLVDTYGIPGEQKELPGGELALGAFALVKVGAEARDRDRARQMHRARVAALAAGTTSGPTEGEPVRLADQEGYRAADRLLAEIDAQLRLGKTEGLLGMFEQVKNILEQERTRLKAMKEGSEKQDAFVALDTRFDQLTEKHKDSRELLRSIHHKQQLDAIRAKVLLATEYVKDGRDSKFVTDFLGDLDVDLAELFIELTAAKNRDEDVALLEAGALAEVGALRRLQAQAEARGAQEMPPEVEAFNQELVRARGLLAANSNDIAAINEALGRAETEHSKILAWVETQKVTNPNSAALVDLADSLQRELRLLQETAKTRFSNSDVSPVAREIESAPEQQEATELRVSPRRATRREPERVVERPVAEAAAEIDPSSEAVAEPVEVPVATGFFANARRVWSGAMNHIRNGWNLSGRVVREEVLGELAPYDLDRSLEVSDREKLVQSSVALAGLVTSAVGVAFGPDTFRWATQSLASKLDRDGLQNALDEAARTRKNLELTELAGENVEERRANMVAAYEKRRRFAMHKIEVNRRLTPEQKAVLFERLDDALSAQRTEGDEIQAEYQLEFDENMDSARELVASHMTSKVTGAKVAREAVNSLAVATSLGALGTGVGTAFAGIHLLRGPGYALHAFAERYQKTRKEMARGERKGDLRVTTVAKEGFREFWTALTGSNSSMKDRREALSVLARTSGVGTASLAMAGTAMAFEAGGVVLDGLTSLTGIDEALERALENVKGYAAEAYSTWFPEGIMGSPELPLVPDASETPATAPAAPEAGDPGVDESIEDGLIFRGEIPENSRVMGGSDHEGITQVLKRVIEKNPEIYGFDGENEVSKELFAKRMAYDLAKNDGVLRRWLTEKSIDKLNLFPEFKDGEWHIAAVVKGRVLSMDDLLERGFTSVAPASSK